MPSALADLAALARPWGVDCGGVWNAWTRLFPTERPGFVLQGPPHKCALIFADNSGVDVILGVFPFVRELLSRGTEVSVGTTWQDPCPAHLRPVGLALPWAPPCAGRCQGGGGRAGGEEETPCVGFQGLCQPDLGQPDLRAVQAVRGRQKLCSWPAAPPGLGVRGGQVSPGCPSTVMVTKELGVLPQVILACNSGPALNDVTYNESLIVAERIAAMDPVIQ